MTCSQTPRFHGLLSNNWSSHLDLLPSTQSQTSVFMYADAPPRLNDTSRDQVPSLRLRQEAALFSYRFNLFLTWMHLEDLPTCRLHINAEPPSRLCTSHHPSPSSLLPLQSPAASTRTSQFVAARHAARQNQTSGDILTLTLQY